MFSPVFALYSPFFDQDGHIVRKKKNQCTPRNIKYMDCLRLLLAWSNTHGSLMVLQLVVGMTMTPVSNYLQFALWIVIKVLKCNNIAKVSMRSLDKFEEYLQAIHMRHPTLDNVCGVQWMG